MWQGQRSQAQRGSSGLHGAGLVILTVLVFSVIMTTCSRRSRERASEAPNPAAFVPGTDLTTVPGTVFEVKFSPNVVKIEPDRLIRSVRSISRDHAIYIFDSSSEVARSLQPGKIMFVPGLTLQKVIATAQDGNDFIIGADDAPLTDVFEQARIHWDYAVNFQQVAAQRKHAAHGVLKPSDFLSVLDRALAPPVWAGEEDKEGLQYGQEKNWKFKLSTKPDAGGLNFEVHLEREPQNTGLVSNIDIGGHINNFRNVTSMLIENGDLQSLEFHNSGMNTYANLVWSARKEKPGPATGEEDFRLPTSFSLPMLIGGIPFTVELSEAVMFKPGFTSAGELARAGFKLEINGDNGFKLSGADVADESNAQGAGSIEDHAGIAPAAPFAVLIAVSAPRLELKTGPEEAFERLKDLAHVPETVQDRLAQTIGMLSRSSIFAQWLGNLAKEVLGAKGAAHVQLIASTSITVGSAMAIIPCQRTQLVMTGNAGVNAHLFKLTKDYEVSFVKKEGVLVLPQLKGCEV